MLASILGRYSLVGIDLEHFLNEVQTICIESRHVLGQIVWGIVLKVFLLPSRQFAQLRVILQLWLYIH